MREADWGEGVPIPIRLPRKKRRPNRHPRPTQVTILHGGPLVVASPKREYVREGARICLGGERDCGGKRQWVFFQKVKRWGNQYLKRKGKMPFLQNLLTAESHPGAVRVGWIGRGPRVLYSGGGGGGGGIIWSPNAGWGCVCLAED